MIHGDTVRKHAEERPRAIAVTDSAESMTWQQFHERVAATVSWLHCRLAGSESARIVAIAPNGGGTVVAASAAATLGVPFVGIDPARDRETILAQLDAVAPDVIVYDTRLEGDLPDALAERGLTVLDLGSGEDPRVMSFADVLAAPPAPSTEWVRPPFTTLGFTSGSTGTPKLFVRRSRTEDQRRRFLTEELDFTHQDVYLVSSPLAHASGHVWANAALALGAQIVFTDSLPAAVLDTIDRYHVTVAFMVPPTVEAVLAAAERQNRRLGTVRALLTGGRHLSARTVRQAGELTPGALYLYYATTETGIVAMATPDDLRRQPLTSGRPMPGVEILIVDPEDLSDVPAGHTGLIAVTSPVNMDGYAAGEAAATLVRGDRTFVVTSDFGRLRDGLLEVAGRNAAGGLDVVAAESALKEDPAVEDVALVGRSSPTGQVLLLALVGAADPQEAASTIRESGACADVDVQAFRAPAIPYNTAGKVDQRALFALADTIGR